MDETERSETPPFSSQSFETVKLLFEQDKLLIRKALEAFNAYSFAMKELVTARNSLASVLEEVYTNEGNPFFKHAMVFSDHLNASSHPDQVDFVSKLKKASNTCRKQYDARFEMLDNILTFSDVFPSKSKRKDKVTEQAISELAAFDEQRLDPLDSLLVQALDSEHKLGLSLQVEEENLSLIAEAKNLEEARQEKFSPKLHMSLKHLLTNPTSIEYLKCFFKKRKMAEGLQFWLEVQKFKQLDGPLMEAGARFIYDLYIGDNGIRQVNLASEYSDPIKKAIKNPTRNIFDGAAKSIASLLEDNLDGFHSSSYYRQMLAHFQPLRSFQEFVADVGGPPASAKTANTNSSAHKAHMSARSVSPPVLMAFRTSPLNLLQSSSAEPTMLTPNLMSETIDIHRTISMPALTVSCMTPTPTEVLCGCLDGSVISLKYDKQATTLDSVEVIPSGMIEGRILTIYRHTSLELFLLTDRGRVLLFDLVKKKVTLKVTKGTGNEPFATGFLRIDANRLWISFGRSIQDWQWNSKKKKYTAITTRELSRTITSLVRIENTVWVGDELGGVTRVHLSTMNPLHDRIRVSQSPVHFIHKSEYSRQLKDFTSTTTRIWVSCRDSTTHVYDSDGHLLQKQDMSVHDLPIIGAANLERHVVLGSEDGSLSVWHSETLALVERVGRVHKDSITAISANSEQKLLYTAGRDRLLAAWQIKPTGDGLLLSQPNSPHVKGSTIPSVNAAAAALERKRSRGARSKSLLDSSPLQEILNSHRLDDANEDENGISSPTRSFTVTVDSLLQLSRHPEDASSLTTHRGLGASSTTDENDYDSQRHTKSSRNSSSDSFNHRSKSTTPDSARSNRSDNSGQSS